MRYIPKCPEILVCHLHTRGLTHIRRGTASTLKLVNTARSQKLGYFILKREEGREACRRTKDKSDVEMRKCGITYSVHLSGECFNSSGWEAEVNDFHMSVSCNFTPGKYTISVKFKFCM